jgi:hypothetical protein
MYFPCELQLLYLQSISLYLQNIASDRHNIYLYLTCKTNKYPLRTKVSIKDTLYNAVAVLLEGKLATRRKKKTYW